jgi:hypothetical protein
MDKILLGCYRDRVVKVIDFLTTVGLNPDRVFGFFHVRKLSS